MEEALNDPPASPMEMEGVDEQEQQKEEKEKRDSTFIWDIGLDKEQDMEDFDWSFQDPNYQKPWGGGV